MLVEIVEELVNGVARRALRVEMQDQPVARVLLDQLAWREMVLEIDDLRVSSSQNSAQPGAPGWRPSVNPSGNLGVNRPS
jgi:hypothetical protein